jgi:hypothetical protein
MMNENELQMLGRIDERTQGIQEDIAGIKKAVSDQYDKINTMRSELDTLIQAHKDRTAMGDGSGSCTQINVPPVGTPKWLVAASAGSGVVGVVAIIVLLIVLRKYGLI